MARTAPGTATADFFIVWGDLPSLDSIPDSDAADPPLMPVCRVRQGHRGHGLVRPCWIAAFEIARTEAMKGQMLEKPVKILTARVVASAIAQPARHSARAVISSGLELRGSRLSATALGPGGQRKEQFLL
jgi:peptidyl-prolyl cis-trans isomerase A (cyclophilin A)